MDCEEIRDLFSALLENDLPLSKEREVKGHLASCADCERDFLQFQKTMNWLHSMGDVEVPADFLEGIYRKLEEAKTAPPAGLSAEKKALHLPLSFKLPVQAMAMVAIVFLVLYVTRMTPMDSYRLKDRVQKEAPQVTARAPETETKAPRPESKAVERKQAPPREAIVPKAKTELAAKAEKVLDRAVPRVADEGTSTQNLAARRSEPAPPAPGQVGKLPPSVTGEPPPVRSPAPPRREMAASETPRARGEEALKTVSPEAGEAKKVVAAREKEGAPETFRKPVEMVVKTSDREKAIPELQDLVDRFGGEILKQEGNLLIASLPASRLAEFERGLSAMSSSHRMGEGVAKGATEPDLRAALTAKKREAGERADRVDHVTVRITLVSD